MTKKKDSKNVKAEAVAKAAPRTVEYLPGVEKEISKLDVAYKIQLKSILHSRIAHGLHPGVDTENLQGKAKGTGLIELKIKSTESVRCFYSVKEEGLVLVAIVFLKKQNDQADQEIKLAVKRFKAFKRQKS